MPRQPSWTDEELIAAVAAATCSKQVCDELGLHPGGGTYRTPERHMTRLVVDGSHLARRVGPRGPKSRRRWTDEKLVAAVAASRSWSELIERLGYAVSGGIHRYIKSHVVHREIDTSHFTSQAWARGRRFPGRRARTLTSCWSSAPLPEAPMCAGA